MLLYLISYSVFANALTVVKEKSLLFSRVVLVGFLIIGILVLSLIYLTIENSNGLSLFGGSFNIALYSHSFNIFILVLTAVILVLTSFYPRSDAIYAYKIYINSKFQKIKVNSLYFFNKTLKQFKILEYSLIITFIVTGAIFLISAGDFISVFLSIELQSYGLYIICTLYRDSEQSTKSGLTYFLLGALSSCFILLGSVLIYSNIGSTYLDNLYIITNLNEFIFSANLYEFHFIHLCLIIFFVGFLFKVSAAPFHFWSPDVYDGIPTVVTTFVAIIAKISIFAFFLELVYSTDYYFLDLSGNTVEYGQLKNVLLLSSLLSLIIGSVLGLTQYRIKRLFAYSTISHIGFILLALSIKSVESIQSYVFYIFQYSITNLNAFILLLSIGYSFYYKEKKENMIDLNNSPVQLVEQLKGYFYKNPFIAISLTITLFSFAGIPPLIGFFAKQFVLSAALDSGYFFMVLVAIITSVISAGYYLNIVKNIFFYKKYLVNEVDYVLKIKNYSFKQFLSYFNNKSYSENYKLVSSNNYSPINSAIGISISVITLSLILFIFMSKIWFSIVNVLVLIFLKE